MMYFFLLGYMVDSCRYKSRVIEGAATIFADWHYNGGSPPRFDPGAAADGYGSAGRPCRLIFTLPQMQAPVMVTVQVQIPAGSRARRSSSPRPAAARRCRCKCRREGCRARRSSRKSRRRRAPCRAPSYRPCRPCPGASSCVPSNESSTLGRAARLGRSCAVETRECCRVFLGFGGCNCYSCQLGENPKITTVESFRVVESTSTTCQWVKYMAELGLCAREA